MGQITFIFTVLGPVLTSPYKGLTHIRPLSCGFDSSEHCTGIAEVVGSNPAQSLKIFSGFCSSSVTAALALMTVISRKLVYRLWAIRVNHVAERFPVLQS